MKNITIILVILVVVFVATRSLIQFLPINTGKSLPVNVTPTVTAVVGNDADVHGCIGSAGYSWCAAKNKCLRPWEEDCDSTAAIKAAIIAKDKIKDDVIVTIRQSSGNYAYGSVDPADGLGGGGMFLAARVNGVWEIPYSGNGMADCAAIKANYQFPADILSRFCR